jgi:tryptophan halogenase
MPKVNRKTPTIIVLGGGTAGWLTALYAKKIHSRAIVKVIASEEIGILGAGEGSMPLLNDFFRAIEVDFEELFQKADATIKNGIRLVDWNGEGNGDYYDHNFNTLDQRLSMVGRNDTFRDPTPKPIVTQIYNESSLEAINVASKLSSRYKVPFGVDGDGFKNEGAFALHFNATKLAALLREKAIARGIEIIDNVVTEVETDGDNNVTALLTNKGAVQCDFVFDCSGFKRFLIGKKFKIPWVSYKEHLPVDTALPFFIKRDKDTDIIPYTEATALKYGWAWRIPTYERFGCGYVFDSSCCTEQEAQEEIINTYGSDNVIFNDKEHPRVFKFDAGRYEKIWVNNCISIGLSSGFIEPLEATAIVSACLALGSAMQYIFLTGEQYANAMRDVNNNFADNQESILNFVVLHYLTDRNDSPFWEKFNRNNTTQFLTKVLKAWENNTFKDYSFERLIPTTGLFGWESYLAVAYGTRNLSRKNVREFCETVFFPEATRETHNYLISRQDELVSRCMRHNILLEAVRGSNYEQKNAK